MYFFINKKPSLRPNLEIQVSWSSENFSISYSATLKRQAAFVPLTSGRAAIKVKWKTLLTFAKMFTIVNNQLSKQLKNYKSRSPFSQSSSTEIPSFKETYIALCSFSLFSPFPFPSLSPFVHPFHTAFLSFPSIPASLSFMSVLWSGCDGGTATRPLARRASRNGYWIQESRDSERKN